MWRRSTLSLVAAAALAVALLGGPASAVPVQPLLDDNGQALDGYLEPEAVKVDALTPDDIPHAKEVVIPAEEDEGSKVSAPSHRDSADGSLNGGQPSPPAHEDGGIVDGGEPAVAVPADADADAADAEKPAADAEEPAADAKAPVAEPGPEPVFNDETSAPPDDVDIMELEDLEPVFLEEDELMYADMKGADMDGYPPEAELEEANKETDEEYQRYLEEMTEDMLGNADLQSDIVKEYKQMLEAVANGEKHDQETADLYEIANKIFVKESRSKLEEQERDLLNRQRRGLKEKIHHDEELDHKANQADFHDPDAFLWNDNGETTNKHMARFKEIAHKRASLLESMDETRKAAFIEHEIVRLIQYRELVQQTKDPKKKQALIDGHKAEQDALANAVGASPGHKKQLAEMWERDGFDKGFVDYKLLFKMHDTNEDGAWDLKEIEAMMWDEAEKLHTAAAKRQGVEVDKFAVKEEMARMRGHFLKDMDKDRDMLVSYEEFMGRTKGADFEKEHAWKALNPERELKEEEIRDFKKHMKKVMKKKKRQGKVHKGSKMAKAKDFMLPPDMLNIARQKLGGKLGRIDLGKIKAAGIKAAGLAKTATNVHKQMMEETENVARKMMNAVKKGEIKLLKKGRKIR